MQNGRRHTVAVSIGGVLGGLLGTAAIQKATGLTEKLPEPLRMPSMTNDPGQFVVGKMEELRGGPLAPIAHTRASKAARWLYGLGWAAGLAALARPLRMHRLGNAIAAGAALGAVNWAVGFLGWLPATGITKPITREHPAHTGTALATHIFYGIVVALPIFAVERRFVRRRIFGMF